MPAYDVLRAGDVITAVDGTPASSADKAASLIRARHPGAPVELTISRNGQTQTVRLVSKSQAGQAAIGVYVNEQFKFPFSVQIRVGDIGGPSAGMMFALGLVDKLTPDNLTGGRFIAGTGEIDANGNVGAIGGIQQKMVGARNEGATIFLAPASNCSDVRGNIPPGLRRRQGEHAQPGGAGPGRDQGGQAGAVVLAVARGHARRGCHRRPLACVAYGTDRRPGKFPSSRTSVCGAAHDGREPPGAAGRQGHRSQGRRQTFL